MSKRILSIILPAIIFVLILWIPDYKLKLEKNNILFQTQSFYGDIKIVEIGPYRCLYLYSNGQSCIDKNKFTDTTWVKALKVLIDQKKPNSILSLGLGGGMSLSVMPDDAKIDAVDYDQKLIDIVRQYDMFPQKEFKIFYDDARHYVKKSSKKYDLIISNLGGDYLPFYMYSQESFLEIQNGLRENGIFFLHLPISTIKEDVFLLKVLKTLSSVFPDIVVVSPNPDDLADVSIVAFAGEDDFQWQGFHSFPVNSFETKEMPIMTDDYNTLERDFLRNVLEARNKKNLSESIYLAD